MGAWKSCNVCDFYPRSPCGERQSTRQIKQTCRAISIHALLAESDITRERTSIKPIFNFYPRSPCGERLLLLSLLSRAVISIHALLAESDNQRPAETTSTTYFYPRSPCGERQCSKLSGDNGKIISIHALLAESDISSCCHCFPGQCISIHALLAESDQSIGTLRTVSVNFYPRSPCGERLLEE